MAIARNARGAPTHPMDDVMWVVNVKRHRAGVIMFEVAQLPAALPVDILADTKLNDS